jgi:hypothetical protein
MKVSVNHTNLGICSVNVKTGKTDTEDTDGDSTEAPMSSVLQCIPVSVASVLSKLTLHIPTPVFTLFSIYKYEIIPEIFIYML